MATEQELLPLPDWSDCELAVDEERATSLQQFIYDNEPAAPDEAKEFRAALQMVLSDARSTTSDYRRGVEDAATVIENVVLSVPSQVMAAYINALCDKLAADVRALAPPVEPT